MNFEIRDRLFLEAQERRMLSPLAAKSEDYHRTRRYSEPEQRDRDRIIHSKAFRCQPACKIDPGSESNFDPPQRLVFV